MPGDALLRIGDFSRASSLSVTALRAYHEAGLLVPADVDRRTGYRSYSVAQLTDAAIIRRLRILDVPLEDIKVVLDARYPAVTKKVLSDHGAVLQERLTVMQRAIEELQGVLSVAAGPLLPAPSRAAGLHVGELPATEVAVVAHEGVYDDMNDSYRNLGAWVAEHAEPADLPVRELYLVGRSDTDDSDQLRTELCWPLRSSDA